MSVYDEMLDEAVGELYQQHQQECGVQYFDEDMQPIHVTMQDLQREVQDHYNYSLLS